jgi:apolipoprotein N-acyltransferase
MRLAVGVGLALLSGGALAAAHPPHGLAPLAFLVAPLLVLALRLAAGADWRDPAAPGPASGPAFALGSIAGAVGYGVMIAWLIAPAGLVGWALLVIIQAAWLGVWAAVVARWLATPLAPVLVGAAWVGMDTLRSLVPLSGFGWGALGYSQVDVSWFVPLARVLGGSGVTFAVVVIGVSLLNGLLGLRIGDRESPPRAPLVQLVATTLAVTLVTVGPPATQGSIEVLAVQGNDIRHWVSQVPNPPLTITENLHRLTVADIAANGRPELVVWPESSVDRDPGRPGWEILGTLVRDAASGSGALVAGVSLDGPDPRTERIVGAWLLAPDDSSPDGADVRDLYVKRRPVPFGEYVPARRWLGWVPGLEQVPRDAIAGAGPQSFEVAPGVRAAVLVCFETLFPTLLRTNILSADVPAGIILAITNDASFRDSSEPAQHLAQSQMRAIETGRWVVHAALSGSSAFVDPEGQVHDATPLFTQAAIRRSIPVAIAPTPFLRVGDLLGTAGAGVLLVLPGLGRRRRPRAARLGRPSTRRPR